MPSPPVVELYPGKANIDEETRFRLTEVRSLEDAMKEAMLAFRAFTMTHVRKHLSSLREINPLELNRLLNQSWELFTPSFGKIMLPYIAATYSDAFIRARASGVPPAMLDALAEEYAKRLGGYFHETSREAMVQGFNTYVNRKVPPRVAAERVVEAYGLTPKQMSGFTSNMQFDAKVESGGVIASAKQKIKNYVAKSLEQRFKIFTKQESHNLQEEAKQVAWSYLANSGAIPKEAEKVWITAKDERVCSQCGPLHGKRVPVMDKFENGLFTPGVHVNCRCEVRLTVVPIGKAADWEEHKHVRNSKGQFSNKPDELTAEPQRPRQRAHHFTPVKEADQEQLARVQAFLDTAISSAEDTVETPAKPVVRPTTRPTARPTARPTVRPTTRPTVGPTVRPTVRPTESVVRPTTPTTPTTAPVRPSVATQETVVRPSVDPKAPVRPTTPPADEPLAPGPSQPPKGQPYVGVLDIEAANGRPLYAVTHPTDGLIGAAYPMLQLGPDRVFMSDLQSTLDMADEHREREVYKQWMKATQGGDVSVSFNYANPQYGMERYIGRVDPADYKSVLETISEAANSEDAAHWAAEPMFEVEVFDGDGYYVSPDDGKTTMMSASEIANHMGVDPEAFHFGVLRLTKAHNHPSRGQTEIFPMRNFDAEEGYTSGDYEITSPPDIAESSDGMTVQVYDLSPYDPYIEGE